MAKVRDLSGNSPVAREASLHAGKTAEVTSTGDIVSRGSTGRIYGVYWVDTATGGSVVIRTGGSSGDILATFDTPAGAGSDQIRFDPDGLLFNDGVHVTLSNVAGVTLVYTDTNVN